MYATCLNMCSKLCAATALVQCDGFAFLSYSQVRALVDSGYSGEVKEVIINGSLSLSGCVIAGFKLYHHFVSSL